MSKLTKDDVDQKFKEMNDFEKKIPGIRFGDDYPEFALAVVGSKMFPQMVTMSTMLGLMTSLMLQGKKEAIESGKGDQVLKELGEDSHMREQLLMALYLGYKLGKGEKE